MSAVSFAGVSALLSDWLIVHGPRIIAILLVSYLAYRFAHLFVERLVRRSVKRGSGTKDAEEKRENTLITVGNGAIGVLVITVASLTLLSEFGIAIGPLLAAAGVAGIALGFGGQYLIRDLISGLFILLENQYRVGDVVCFDTTCGLVETLSLRMTTLRDLDGTVHHVPHGEVKKVSNLSKTYARVNLNIGIAYSANLEQVIAVVNQVGQNLANDADWKDKIISPPQFLRVNDFGESAVIIKILGDTQPLAQWDVAGELRKRLKIAFDAQGIEIPFPQRTIHTAA